MKDGMSKATAHNVWFKALGECGYHVLDRQGLTSASFPDTFAPSAFHDQIYADGRGAGRKDPVLRCGIDWVFRHVDLNKIGTSAQHLSSFEMAIAYAISPMDASRELVREHTIGVAARALGRLGMRLEECYFTCFGGVTVGNTVLHADGLTSSVLEKHGVPPAHIDFIGGVSLLTNVRKANEPAGPRCEVYYRTSSGLLIEIATLVFEEFRWKSDLRNLAELGVYVHGLAVGVERSLFANSGAATIFEIEAISPAFEYLREQLGSVAGEVCHAEVCCAIDALRSLLCIMVDGQPIVGKNRNRIFKRVVRSYRAAMRNMGLDLEKHTTELLPILLVEHEATEQPGCRVRDEWETVKAMVYRSAGAPDGRVA